MTAAFTPSHKLSAVLLLLITLFKLVNLPFSFPQVFPVKACCHDGSSTRVAVVDNASKLLRLTCMIVHLFLFSFLG